MLKNGKITGAMKLFRDNFLNALIPCGVRNCDNCIFDVYQDSPDSKEVIVTCFACRYKQKLSIEKYESIIQIKDFLMYQELTYGSGWDDKILKERERES